MAQADLDPETKAGYLRNLALTQRVAGDIAGAKATAEQALKISEPLYRDRPDSPSLMRELAFEYACMGEKDLALKLAGRAVMLQPRSKDAASGPTYEEDLAIIQALVGENSRAIANLTQLLKTPYFGGGYRIPITPALLRLDPIWDPLRADPAFQKLCDEKIDKSIAVLPFDNLSGDPNNAYFAEGIQEEILTRLAKIADLKVISRASTQRYQSKPRDLGEIAKQLGVANILEGSVQKAADQVRVNVKLISAQTDSHLWAESYDQKLTDILGVESHIAKRVAASLQAKLTGGEEQALAVKPTKNPEAYDAYLRGLAFEIRNLSAAGQAPSSEAIGFYERAVLLDPNFAVGWARLSRVYAHTYFNRVDAATAAHGEAAKRALENAQRLEPYSPETLLALGYYQFRVLRDYASAKATFDRASKALPGSSEVREALALVVRRGGHWDQSIAYFEQALALDPRNVQLLVDAASNYGEVRQFSAALNLYDRALDISPNDPDLVAAKASIYQAQGNLQEAAKFLSEIRWQTESEATLQTIITQLKLERKYSEAIRLLQPRLEADYAGPIWKICEQLLLASMQRLGGDTADAKITAQQARNTLEQLYRDQPDNGTLAALLSQYYALVGEKDSALKEAERAMTLWPAKDRVSGPQFEENLAAIKTMFGDNNGAISALTRLLQTPYLKGHLFSLTPPMVITRALLKLDPFWDPLRGDPAFQKLCEEKQP
ncbi:MAG: tetratricopeptide repeat protein [Chthoniobacterales bacterium]